MRLISYVEKIPKPLSKSQLSIGLNYAAMATERQGPTNHVASSWFEQGERSMMCYVALGLCEDCFHFYNMSPIDPCNKYRLNVIGSSAVVEI